MEAIKEERGITIRSAIGGSCVLTLIFPYSPTRSRNMFKTTAVLALIASASAFVPTGRMAQSGMQMMAKKSSPAPTSAFDDEIGALPPVGFWDPLGLAADGNVEVFNRRRASELKHGRIAMLAVVGYLVQENYRLPGAIDLDGTTFDSIPNGVAAIGAVKSFGWLQVRGKYNPTKNVKSYDYFPPNINSRRSSPPSATGSSWAGRTRRARRWATSASTWARPPRATTCATRGPRRSRTVRSLCLASSLLGVPSSADYISILSSRPHLFLCFFPSPSSPRPPQAALPCWPLWS